MDEFWVKVFPNLMRFANWPIVRPHNSKRAGKKFGGTKMRPNFDRFSTERAELLKN
jgi:hypothetical protein